MGFDYNRLYRGRSRNVSEASTEEKEWKGFSSSFAERNLKKKKIEKVAEAEEEMDAMLAMDDEAEMARQSERARLQRESASKFLQRQKDKCVEAQRRAKERIAGKKTKDGAERRRLAAKRETARLLAMKVADKIALKMQEQIASEEMSMEQMSAEAEAETDSENLFDKLRKKGVANADFGGSEEANEESFEATLSSQRSVGTLERMRREKKRSLAVTGRILKVLSDKSNESMDAEDLMVFLHTLSKSKRKKMKRDKLAMAYGVQQKPKKKKKKAPRADKGLGSFLQIGQIKMC